MTRLNAVLDTLPAREVFIGDRLVSSWQALAAIGLLAGLSAELVLGATLEVPPAAVLSTAVLAAATYGLWSLVRRSRSGRFTHVLLEGLLVLLGAAALDAHLLGVAPGRLLDVSVVGFSVWMVFGRMGCAAAGCCHGATADLGIVYPPGCPAGTRGVRRAPVQLLESGLWLVLTVVAILLARVAAPGVGAGTVLSIYAMARHALERLRDDHRSRWLGISEARWTSVPLGLLGVYLASGTRVDWRLGVAWGAWLVGLCTLHALATGFGHERQVDAAALEGFGRELAARLERDGLIAPTHATVGAHGVEVAVLDGLLALAVHAEARGLSRTEARVVLERILWGLGMAGRPVHGREVRPGQFAVALGLRPRGAPTSTRPGTVSRSTAS